MIIGIYTEISITIDLVYNPLIIANNIINLLYYLYTKTRLI